MKTITPNELKTRRSRMGLSQTALAQKLSRSLPTIQRWEAGTSPIPLELDLALKYLELSDFVDRLKAAVSWAEKEFTQKVVDVEIPLWLAREFLGWSPQDWAEHFGKWMTPIDCQRAADTFFQQGERAFENLRLGPVRITVAVDPACVITFITEEDNARWNQFLFPSPSKKRPRLEEDENQAPASRGDGADSDSNPA